MPHPLPRLYSRTSAAALVLIGLLAVSSARAQVTPPAGYVYAPQVLESLTQSCIAVGPGGTFVGIGQAFTANGQAIVLARESGALRLVALGFNSIADCVYDGAGDVLYVTDNAGELPGTTTGDTVFAIPSASTAAGLPAATIELLPANSIADAMSLAVGDDGNLLVSDATGGMAGTVQSIDVDGHTAAPFASGFAFTGGLAVDPATGDVLVAESLPSFEAQISQFDSAGGSLGSFAGPSFGFGSFDLAFNTDGSLLATGAFGGNVVALDTSGTPVPFVGGLTFASGISVNGFTGRVEILSSTFSVPSVEEDRSIHRFIPVDRLVPGNGAAASECAHEFYGLELVAPAPGKKARKAICADGDPCDADGTVNDRCLFPAGFCLEIADSRLPACTPSPVVDFSVTTKPVNLAVAAAAAAVQNALPVSTPACFFSDGIAVPVTVRPRGKSAGRATLRVKATRANGKKDADAVTLLCAPA